MSKCFVLLACVLSLSVTDARQHQLHTQMHLQQAVSSGSSSANSDATVVATALGSTPVTVANLKAFISSRGLSADDLIDELMLEAACIARLELLYGSQLTIPNLQDYLTNRDQLSDGTKDDLFSRACAYLADELVVSALFGKAIPDIATEDLKAKISTFGAVSTTGTKGELVARLGDAQSDLTTIQTLLNDPTIDPTNLNPLLISRGLPTTGDNIQKLQQLADYLSSLSQTVIPGVSSTCTMVLESAVCVSGGEKVFASDAIPRGLVGKWTFDDAYMLDSSGMGNNVLQVSGFGPGFNGFGESAHFDGNSMIQIPHTDAFSNSDFCVSLWLYLLSDSTGQWRTILHKGARDTDRTPTFFLEPQTRGIEFFVSTTDNTQPAGERLWSTTFVPLRKWTHIVGCAEGNNLRLYLNGILDAENTTVGTPIMNQGPIYVGNDPWRPAGGIAGYVDELRYYSRSLSTDEIQAEAQAALGIVEPSFVELGCMGCSLDNCPKTCRKDFQVCTQRDLLSGGYFVARSMGWASIDTQIWKAEDGKTASVTSGNQPSGLCMCCRIAQF